MTNLMLMDEWILMFNLNLNVLCMPLKSDDLYVMFCEVFMISF